MQRLLTQNDASELLQLSVRTLERFRVNGLGPKFVRMGKSVRYREGDLSESRSSRVVQSTCEGSRTMSTAASFIDQIKTEYREVVKLKPALFPTLSSAVSTSNWLRKI